MSSSVLLRGAAAGVLAALLVTGCGGGGSSSGSSGNSYSVSVAVSGLSGTLVMFQGSGMLNFTADGTETFSSLVPAGDIYAVTVGTQPATQYCAVASNGTGLIDAANVTVDVTCNASTGGIWTGTGQNGDSYVAMADESGDFWLLDTDANGDIYVYGGALTVSGSGANASVSGSDTGQALTGTYSDGSSFGSGTIGGTLNPRSALTINNTFTTTTPTVLPMSQFALTYSSVYSQGSSLADVSSGGVAGNYTEGTTTLSISTGGILFAQDSNTHCVLNGIVDPMVSSYDLYSVQYTYGDCTGNSTLLNGLTYNGFGAVAPPNSVLNSKNVPYFIAVAAATLTTGYTYEALNLASD